MTRPAHTRTFIGTKADNLNGRKIFSFVSGWMIASQTKYYKINNIIISCFVYIYIYSVYYIVRF